MSTKSVTNCDSENADTHAVTQTEMAKVILKSVPDTVLSSLVAMTMTSDVEISKN